jgi:hypothetical protein
MKECHDGRRNVTCFERRFYCCIANVGFLDAAKLDGMKGADKGIAKA